MKDIGGPMSSIKPEQVLLVTIAGSALYNLKVPDSDVDYLVVYAIPIEVIASHTQPSNF
jgi:predicted nucleotidyltransferase